MVMSAAPLPDAEGTECHVEPTITSSASQQLVATLGHMHAVELKAKAAA